MSLLAIRTPLLGLHNLHDLFHRVIQTSQRLMTSPFKWEEIYKDVRWWASICSDCQDSKVTRHTFSASTSIPVTERFDNVDTLPPSAEDPYILTWEDRFTGWLEIDPIASITRYAVAHAFIATFVSRFGVPLSLTSDHDIHRYRTSSYHIQVSDMVERFHRQLKSSFMASTLTIDPLPLPKSCSASCPP